MTARSDTSAEKLAELRTRLSSACGFRPEIAARIAAASPDRREREVMAAAAVACGFVTSDDAERVRLAKLAARSLTGSQRSHLEWVVRRTGRVGWLECGSPATTARLAARGFLVTYDRVGRNGGRYPQARATAYGVAAVSGRVVPVDVLGIEGYPPGRRVLGAPVAS